VFKKGWASVVAMSLVFVGSASAAIVAVDLSPSPGLALNSANYLSGDHALGIAATNAVGQPASLATGNEIGLGITFDDVTKVLSWNIGYGSDHGFVDLLGNLTVAHIHGPNAVAFPSPNTGASVLFPLTHTPGSSTKTGSFTGSIMLSPSDETSLLNNLLYINIHSSFATGGEIRGQFVPVPEPTTAFLFVTGSIVLIGGTWRRRQA